MITNLGSWMIFQIFPGGIPIYFVNKNNKKVYKIEGRGGSCVPAVLGSNLGTTEAVKIHQGPHRAEPRHHPR